MIKIIQLNTSNYATLQEGFPKSIPIFPAVFISKPKNNLPLL